MIYNLQEEATVDNLGKIFYISAPFNQALDILKKNRINHPITARDLAYARIQEGKHSSLSTNDSYVKEGSLFIPKSENKRYLVRDSFVLKDVDNATDHHAHNQEYFLEEKVVNDYLQKQSKSNDLFIVKDLSPIPTNRFDQEAITNWLFQDQAKDYGLFLKDAKIKQLSFYLNSDDYIDKQKAPFANQLWLGALDLDSVVDGDGGGLYCTYWVRGVLKESREASTSKKTAYHNLRPPFIRV